jgi:hypothetical protein
MKLQKGEILTYDFGKTKMYAYQTNDSFNDVVFILEKNKKRIVIEPPCFFENIKELEEYINSLNLTEICVIPVYHMMGASFLPNAKKYSTKRAEKYGHLCEGKKMVDNFSKIFGEAFDNKLHSITSYIKNGNIKIADIKMNIIGNSDAFDIEIPEINALYMHMLGHDSHSIITGQEHAEIFIKQLENYARKQYKIILSAHHVPENLRDLKTKIRYLKKLKRIALSSKSSEEFKTSMNNAYPNYYGENYLDMTAGFFFK